MDSSSFIITGKSSTPLQLEQMSTLENTYATLFAIKQIKSKSLLDPRVLGVGEDDQGLSKKMEKCLQKTISKPKRTRRTSFLLKEGHKRMPRDRPSSKRFPPLDDKAKDSMNKREIILMKTLLDIPPPFVTSRCWAVANGKTGKVLFGRLENEVREIASLTKILVCLTVIKLSIKMSFNLKTTIIQVTEDASMVGGTSAKLKSGDCLTIWDLLHGLMLPSGNDCGYLLAEHFGHLLKKSGEEKGIIKPKNDPKETSSEDTTVELDTTESKESDDDECPVMSKYLHRFSCFKYGYIKYFLMEMNYIAKEEIGCKNSFFDSPHGLMNRWNTSTASDLAKISAYSLKNKNFSKITKTKRYKCYTKKPHDFDEENPGEEFKPSLYSWDNTNKLLWKLGFDGLKTGITPSAGPCLVASYTCSITKDHYIIILLNSKSMEHRWNEVSKLKAWACARMRKIKHSNILQENSFREKKSPFASINSKILTKIKHL
ncbi:unnamed protein product [Moneuplotes crassus]|uniref:Peptidase S11 D-alanyl-D-alanine carboxypeptidase A N-terminal domain-containing protein n=1 Tax=Euplotes crassus TaxID=5936 RepID=A0AAD1UGG0_EUPCR|nr:unnamed protein product [Moneuplotes crassus]